MLNSRPLPLQNSAKRSTNSCIIHTSVIINICNRNHSCVDGVEDFYYGLGHTPDRRYQRSFIHSFAEEDTISIFRRPLKMEDGHTSVIINICSRKHSCVDGVEDF
jgi:hypothetical protein